MGHSPGPSRNYNVEYRGASLERIAFPLGGIGAGMVCLEGTGKISHVSVRHRPEVFHEPMVFSSLLVKGLDKSARVLEGPVPAWKVQFPWGGVGGSSGSGGSGKDYGLPRFREAAFRARFPFGTIVLSGSDLPVGVRITGWSPFIPNNSLDSSLPVGAIEYGLTNQSSRPIDLIYGFHARNFMQTAQEGAGVRAVQNGFMLWQPGSTERPWDQGAFCAVVDDPRVEVNHRWFRGGWFDALSMLWREIELGAIQQNPPIVEAEPSPGGSLYLGLSLGPGEQQIVRLLLAWHVPQSDLRLGEVCCDSTSPDGAAQTSCSGTYRPWYAGQFGDVAEVVEYWKNNYTRLRQETIRFRDCFYDTTLPDEIVEAVAANLTILKSPTVLRQTDGRLWCWEGCLDSAGCCMGSCTHVWNYAQAIPHLFADLERTLRETEFDECQDDSGHQVFRAPLPICEAVHARSAAADGQLGGVLKVYREWRISGDTSWMQNLWPRVRASLEYCIETWDPDHHGVLVEPHHNTYDIEFWGADSMCSGIYVGALKAATTMAAAVDDECVLFRQLYERGRRCLEQKLFNGEYFFQETEWEDLKAGDPAAEGTISSDQYTSPEALELLAREGPKYQYGSGCLSDGLLGAWLSAVCGLDDVLDPDKARSHLLAVHRYNWREDLTTHANPQRPTYALGKESGLLLCTWPRGERPTLPFVYSDEVWTGIEYQVASHLLMMGCVEEALQIVRGCRDRYGGDIRNPFDEYECGHWYARALSSYALLQGYSGVRYDAVEKHLYIRPPVDGDFRSFLCTATGYGVVGVEDGQPFVEAISGVIEVTKVVFESRPRTERVHE